MLCGCFVGESQRKIGISFGESFLASHRRI
jgi:hypothetical protein